MVHLRLENVKLSSWHITDGMKNVAQRVDMIVVYYKAEWVEVPVLGG